MRLPSNGPPQIAGTTVFKKAGDELYVLVGLLGQELGQTRSYADSNREMCRPFTVLHGAGGRSDPGIRGRARPQSPAEINESYS